MKRLFDTTLAAALLTSLALAHTAFADQAHREEAARYEKLAMAAYQAKDFAGFLANTRKAFAERPESSRIAYNLVCAEALAGEGENAIRDLGALIDTKLWLDVEADPDLASIRALPSFGAIRKKLQALKVPVGHSTEAFRLKEKDLITEGLAYDPETGAFFVSSVHKRKIVTRSAAGAVSDFTTEGQDGLWAVLALRVDGKRRVLWACSAATREMSGWKDEDKGLAGVFKYDLATKKLVKKYLAPKDGRAHNMNDLTIGARGEVYISDAVGSGLYRITPEKDELEEFLPPGPFGSPQGLALLPGEKTLVVADYGGGLTAVDLGSKARHALTAPDRSTLLGIDGLSVRGNELIAIQNGVEPHRVTRLTLDPKAPRIEKAAVLEMNNPSFQEPTLGVVVGDTFYYVANSQWGSFAKDGSIFPADKLHEPVILRVSLE